VPCWQQGIVRRSDLIEVAEGVERAPLGTAQICSLRSKWACSLQPSKDVQIPNRDVLG
jgi:hypothetical protein